MTRQVPTPQNAWLTRNLTENEETREFAKVLLLPAGAEQWDECTQEFYESWQEQHAPKPVVEEPQQPEE